MPDKYSDIVVDRLRRVGLSNGAAWSDRALNELGSIFEDAMGDVVLTQSFGVKGDGVSDDSFALQAMVDSKAVQPGTSIDFGDRTYRVTRQIVLNKPNIVLLMSRAKILIDNQYDGFMVFNRQAHNVFVDRPNVLGIQERTGNPRSYYIAQGINQWYGTAGYAKASAFLATDVKNLTIWRPIIENCFYCINVAGWNVTGGIAENCRIESPILINTDFGILAVNQKNFALTGYSYGRLITKTTADPALGFEGLEPHYLYFSEGQLVASQYGVYVGDVFVEDNDWDSAVKIKSCPGIVVKSIHAKAHNIITQISDSPNARIGPLIGTDMYRSQSATNFVVGLLNNVGLTLDSLDVQIRDGENLVGGLRLVQNNLNCQFGKVSVRSSCGANTPVSIVQLEDASHNNTFDNVSWTDPGTGVINRAVISITDCNGTRIGGVVTRGDFRRIVHIAGTSSDTIACLDAGMLDAFSADGIGFREVGTGTGNAVYWRGGSKNNRQYTGDFTMKGADNNSPIRAAFAAPGTVTFSSELKVGMQGEVIQYSTGNVTFAGSGVTLRGLTGLTAINTAARWRVAAAGVVLITAG